MYRAVAWAAKIRMYRQLLNFTCCPRNPWVTARGGGGGGGGKLAYMLWFNRPFPSFSGPLYQKSHIWYTTCVPELRALANRTMIVASLAGAFTWLLWNQTDLELNTRASRPYTMHISRYNKSIPRMWTDLGKTSLYSEWSTADQE